MDIDEPGSEAVNQIFDSANFVRDLNIRLAGVGDGWCETTLDIQDRFRQQHGFVRGGVIGSPNALPLRDDAR
jgi:acyl-coenzyme A thioesterase PaaI-like protein